MYRGIWLAAITVFIFSCAPQKGRRSKGLKELRFLSEYTIPHKMHFEGTTIGGLSSIEYDAAKNVYYLICDDRSDINPARFYTATIDIGWSRIDTVIFTNVTTLLQSNGKPYPNRKEDSLHVPDPEALRYNPTNGTMVWSSEGERIVRWDKLILVDPAITMMTSNGRFLDTFPLPPNLRMHRTEKGPRQNGVFEGLTFTPDYNSLFVSVEEPLFEDGPRAGLNDTTGWIRLVKYDVVTKNPVAQYAYQIDPVVQEPISEGLFIVNGVSDILAINDHQLLVTERSFSSGRLTCNVRVYLADLEGATNIAAVHSLVQQPAKNPIRKKLLLNMDNLGRWIDNVEGATFGPVLPNGNRSLIFVTDDNFAAYEKTQFFLFEVR